MSKYDPSRYATPSTGDPAADRRAIDDHVRSTMLIDEGRCPNAPKCEGVLSEVEPGEWHCSACRFVQYRRTWSVGA